MYFKSLGRPAMRLTGGIVMCGGRSSRMGRPKCWLPFADELMLPRVVRLVSEAVAPVVVVAAPGQELPALPADVILTCDPEDGRGPLQGLIAGLAALPDGTDAAYVSSCDVPFLRPEFVRRMIQLIGRSSACMPRVDGRLHPLAAAYRRDVAAVADRLLAAGKTRLTDLCTAVRTRIVTADELTDADPDLRSLRNVNTPEDYEAALREAAGP
jgi:molybdopterin-guanine dinucleotide biosynthesis protein A